LTQILNRYTIILVSIPLQVVSNTFSIYYLLVLVVLDEISVNEKVKEKEVLCCLIFNLIWNLELTTMYNQN
jgi:hypothetical protein